MELRISQIYKKIVGSYDPTDPTILHDPATILCDPTKINMICDSAYDPDRFWLSGS